jgi:lysozyme
VSTSAIIAEAVEVAAALCRPFEGLRLTAYICPAGYPTIGYGTVYKPDGSKVTMNHPPITKETAEAWLVHELMHNYLAGVVKASPILLAHPKALGALTDFAYNLGVARYRASTLRKRIDVQDWPGAREQLALWVFGGGKKLPGLVKRRAAEAVFLPIL